MFFKASLDKMSKVVSSIAAIAVAVIFILYISNIVENFYILNFVAIVLAISLLFGYLFSPLGYEINNDSIDVKRRFGKFIITRNEILSIEKLPESEIRGAIRLFGNSGILGYTGWFYNKSQGRMRMFLSQRKNLVSIVLQNRKKYILSPDDVEEFIKATQW